MRSDARALLGDRLLRDLDQYFLTFTKQIRDRRLLLPISSPGTSLALTASIPTSIARIAAAPCVATISWLSCRSDRSGRRRNCFRNFFRSCHLFCDGFLLWVVICASILASSI